MFWIKPAENSAVAVLPPLSSRTEIVLLFWTSSEKVADAVALPPASTVMVPLFWTWPSNSAETTPPSSASDE